jgi:SAM-dependent methyltransferase
MPDPYYASDGVTLYLDEDAGCLAVLPTLPNASVDAIVTDPPYELGFMGKAWDASGIAYNVDVWRECWRVLKPGGHLLAFGGTRTYHRMTVAIEDAGFEIRDSLHWIYGTGYPKGQNIAKSIDKRRDDRQQVLKVTAWLAAARDAAGWSTARIDALFGFNGMASHWTAIASKAASVPTPEQWDRLRDAMGFDDTEIRPLVAELNARRGTLGEAAVFSYSCRQPSCSRT